MRRRGSLIVGLVVLLGVLVPPDTPWWPTFPDWLRWVTAGAAAGGGMLLIGGLGVLMANEGHRRRDEACTGQGTGWRGSPRRLFALAYAREEPFAAVKRALHEPGWWRNAHWAPFLLAALGGLLAVYGGLGCVVVASGIPAVSLTCAGVLVYATIRLAAAWHRA